ncbi:kielin/chordin-like protein isoform X2 [Brienomyrus brachyistius]|uniref:kielin/chordin-like protein isoform X2 n=1 Tax=Brienomyrus brachyistius TaxID=42636 RepID=UPI0020B270C7|nr:kielin/chordin-like protein isoform X2 [Brienomyrus brachyistius]
MSPPGRRSALATLLVILFVLMRARESALLHQDDEENVIDLLEALNMTRSIRGVTRAKALDLGVLAWKLHQRAPPLTLPQDFSRYFLSSVKGAIGFHFIAQQAKSSDGTLISLVSPAAVKQDGHPLIRLLSSTRTNQLQLDYRTAAALRPASLRFPGGTPFASGHWARVALSLETHRVTLFIDCKEAVVLEKSQSEELLSLLLPLDLEITLASMPGKKTSKFLGHLQRAEVSMSGYQRRPWRCENVSDPNPPSMLSRRSVQTNLDGPHQDIFSLHWEPQSDMVRDQPQRTPLGPPGLPHGSRASPSGQEERLQRLEQQVETLRVMVDMLKAQNTKLQTRVEDLESCECRRPTCLWDGQEVQDGARWEMNGKEVCVCTGGKVQCAVSDGCSVGGQRYRNGEGFRPDACSSCVCQSGAVQCQKVQCRPLSCLKQDLSPGECCPVCLTGCEYEEEVYENGAVFVSQSNPCMNCSCSEGLVRCSPVQCLRPQCSNPVQIRGQCCPTCSACDLDGRPARDPFTTADGCQTCSCQGGNLSCVDVHHCPRTCSHGLRPPLGPCCPDCSRCVYRGRVFLDGVSFLDEQEVCRHCTCTVGNVMCTTLRCPVLQCVAVETVDGECCPRCKGCQDGADLHEHGATWRHQDRLCSVCTCSEGQIQCVEEQCNIHCKNPASPLPGSCCPVCDGCSVNGLEFLSGDHIPTADRCQECMCVRGDLRCAPVPCSLTPCRNPVHRPGECCPRCDGCEYDSQLYADGQIFVSSLDPCVSCHCLAGLVSCERLDSNCAPPPCSHPARSQGQCCPSCDTCEYEGRVYTNGKTFTPPGIDPCLQCTCQDGSVSCHQQQCPAVQCPSPALDPQLCCPFCKVCVVDGMEFEEGTQWQPDEQPCNSCTCIDGEPVCQESACPPASCLHPSRLSGSCCATCDRCTYNQRLYDSGQEFTHPDDTCQRCTCQDGTVQCVMVQCPRVSCPSPLTPPGQCCPRCPGCAFENHMFMDGERFPSPVNPCQECVCHGGRLDCVDTPCPRPGCSSPLPGTCCQNNCNGCSYAGKEYPNGMEFPHPTDHCRSCHCLNGNVQCLMKRCAPQQCSNPYMTPGECCPKCPELPPPCQHSGRSHLHGERFYDPADACRICICTNGYVSCRHKPCSPAHCSHPILQDCCPTCDGCSFGGVELSNGEVFPDASDPCRDCVCREGTVTCESRRCPPVACPYPVGGHCCQACDGCNYIGTEYLDGQEFPDPRDPCSRCMCAGGHVTCSPKPCYSASCAHPVTPQGACCPTCEGCLYGGVTFTDGQSFPDPGQQCSECVCRAGTVQCARRACPPAPCPHPAPASCDCPVCDGCFFQGRTLLDGESFPGPKSDCEECRCSKGEVTCGWRRCPKANCPHPETGPCSCPLCGGCSFHGRSCSNGERFPHPEDKCQLCVCLNGGVSCVPVSCPPVPCRDVAPPPPGECCPVCPGSCLHLGHLYESGSSFESPADGCSTCTCLNKVVTCLRRPCPRQCSHPVPSASCCPSCDSCQYEGVIHAHLATFSPVSSPCQRCSCTLGSVSCIPVVCTPLPCPNPITVPGECCPKCPVCTHQGAEYREAARWLSKADCQDCVCVGGKVQCAPPSCPQLTCVHQVMDEGSCCPRCRGCVYNGETHADGSTWLASSAPCMSCMCLDGVTTCSEVRCVSPCVTQVLVPGECCPLCADCVYDGRTYSPGESFHLTEDPCQICTCEVLPDGMQHLHCYRKLCPSLVDCPKSNILFSGPDLCCPVCAQPLSNCTISLGGSEVHATDDPCYSCHCKDLTWTCTHRGCLPLSCPPTEQFTPHDACCPVCQECVIESENRRVASGVRWTDNADECVTCTCSLGYIECSIEECASAICQDGFVKVKTAGKCCYECQDPNVSCTYQGTIFLSNEHWQVDECTSCTCVSGEVHCRTERCPPTPCAADETPALIPGMCCPHCIPRPATCVAFGDPHYRTFDGKMVNFQGSCTYVLAEDCEGGDFSIHVTNEDRGRTGVSWTKEVTVFIADVVVQLLQNWVVMVDDQTVTLPFLREPYVYVERKTSTILLNTNIGMKVLWNSRGHIEVSVPGTYKSNMCGLCGNFNNYPQDDMRLPSGQMAASEAGFGNSWKVLSSNGTVTQCHDGQDMDPCKEAGYAARKVANARCGVLKSAVFERCHRLVPPQIFYAACVYDLCACGPNVEECLCDVLGAYAAECRQAGVLLHWRSPTLCAVGCPLDRGFVFDECGPPCPKTCFNKDVPLGVIESHCFKPCVPGCQCPAGLLEHESHCITPEACPKIIYGNS